MQARNVVKYRLKIRGCEACAFKFPGSPPNAQSSTTKNLINVLLQVVTLGSKTWDWGLLLTGLPLCLATRAANIFPLSRLANTRRKLPLSINLQVRDLQLSKREHCIMICVIQLSGQTLSVKVSTIMRLRTSVEHCSQRFWTCRQIQMGSGG